MKKLLTHLKHSVQDDIWIIALDVVAVNASYILALLLRFSISNEYNESVASYIRSIYSFAPFYTIICFAVFLLFRLYSGMWRY